MALPLPPGLTPPEVAFLCEMEMVTIIPRQRLESLSLLGGRTPVLIPPHRSPLPLWLALLLKRQKRCNIVPPPFLLSQSLEQILAYETLNVDVFSAPPPHPLPTHSRVSEDNTKAPPFLPSCTANAPSDHLPYHWLELGEIILEAASDDIPSPDQVRSLLRDLREVRMSKMRGTVKNLKGGGIFALEGVGAMEVAEGRGFIVGATDSLRKIGASRETARREREEEGGADVAEDEDDDMSI